MMWTREAPWFVMRQSSSSVVAVVYYGFLLPTSQSCQSRKHTTIWMREELAAFSRT
eukprot:m.252475 g.252475  ORF g.252475 m.252475 type:complete len:56 (+) comp15473_c2_seq12:21-188(+)